MPRLLALDPDQASPDAASLLGEIIDRNGDAGPMVRTMAHSPALLRGYLELSRAMRRVALPRRLSEQVCIAVQEWIGCELCRAAHIAEGQAAGLSATDIALARDATARDANVAALLSYAVRVLIEPYAITDADLDELHGHGWGDRVLADVVGLVALNQLTGSFNLVAGLAPDESIARAAEAAPT